MLFAEQEPPRELAGHVDCLWLFQVAPDAGPVEHWVPPDGGLTLSFSNRGGQLMLAGPFLQPMKPPVQAGDEVWGVRLRPGAGSHLLAVDAQALRNRILPAAQLLPYPWVQALSLELAEAAGVEEVFAAYCRALETLLPQARPVDGPVQSVVEALIESGGQAEIGSLADRTGLSPRQLRRRFRAATGLSPKELARIRRFRASAVEAVLTQKPPWAEVAAGHGFADQAHLVREYRRIIGLAPKDFKRQFTKIRHGLLHKDREG
ncbi:MAG: AraC family transcriptional regulator [Acidobacteria bacterium]|nr:AraC family transcriptional regulator [Acidobacteriota bacterium]